MSEDLHQRLRGFWDLDAEVYDRSPSHAVSDPLEASAWRAALRRHLPAPGARVLDMGAGTGAMSLLAAELGYRVTSVDLSPGMLSRAGEKARQRGLLIETIVAPATEPPAGPFDAVMERHVLWTTPDPLAALTAWRDAAPTGRLVLFEGIWNRDGIGWRLRTKVAQAVRAATGVRHDHHGAYDPDLLASLPLARATSPGPLLELVQRAGWRAVRVERLRDVEWARRAAAGSPLGWLESAPQFAVLAEA